MLNSLVRVSRRVRGATDLLATETQAVSARTLAIRACSGTRLLWSQARRAWPCCANSRTKLHLRPFGPREVVRDVRGQRSAAARQSLTSARGPCGSPTHWLPRRQPEPPASTSRAPPFTTTQFHVLLNSLFKVLFNFPSRYLFAIGLGVIFSLTWSLPRTLSCTPKQLDSREKPVQQATCLTGLSPSAGRGPSQGVLERGGSLQETLPNTTCHATERAGGSVLGSARFIRHY